MLALTNARIITMEDVDYDKGTILIKDGEILAIGENIEIPKNYEILDVNGKYILPGFIDAHTHIGIIEEIYQIEGDDVNEITDPITPALRAMDGVNPYDIGFDDAIAGGVTTVMVAPGSANVIGGLVCILKTGGETLADKLINSEAGLKIAFGENPKSVYGEEKKMPYTRMASISLLRETFIEGINYLNKEDQERDLQNEAIAKVLNKEIPLRAHAHRADDILAALRVAKEFDLKIIIEHATEGHKIIKELKKENVSVVVGPSLGNRSKVELRESSFKTPGILAKENIEVALTTDHPETPIQYLNICAALAVREGMLEKEALKAITINPARILGIDKKVGSLKVGKQADVVIWNNHPLNIMSKPQSVYIRGKKFL
ncbi:Imidazolonepropionase [Desulfonispora thiosulfatigenes DSM 11270]|uniref:Imidazolonepropionase n=1 Tax=Desulfonispora thiosulfatigenes DSM 11270 TaxID=656914 RepID=A0A1W1V8A0_DESTI|nr:amidohydrolase [Desulfonispora thiosulfatigenes]SMB89707.1 Imidazolonepropionase [Desulfonispora thiosulfatigenes DSM 11270]